MDYLTPSLKIFLFFKKPSRLIYLIAATSILAVFLSILIFYVENQKSNLEATAMFQNDIANRFVEKNDVLRLTEALSKAQLEFPNGDKFTIPVERSFVEQTTNAYFTLAGVQYVENSCTDLIRNTVALPIFDFKVLDNANNLIFTNFAKVKELEDREAAIFTWLVLIQIVNTLLTVIFFYIDKKAV